MYPLIMLICVAGVIDSIQERCLKGRLSSKISNPSLHCVLFSSEGWMYLALRLQRYSVNISEGIELPNASVAMIVLNDPYTWL